MSNSEVNLWLNILDKQKKETISLFVTEYNKLTKLAPVRPTRVIKTPSGEPRLFFINRLEAIQLLKDLYQFHDKKEIHKVLKDTKDGINI